MREGGKLRNERVREGDIEKKISMFTVLLVQIGNIVEYKWGVE